jgi:ribosomal protein S18 acetylase RimI-like enzyme
MNASAISTEPATPDDTPALVALDEIARDMTVRAQHIEAEIAAGRCFKILLDGSIVGYYILNRSFFHRPYLDLLYLAAGHRDKGAGAQVLKTLLTEFAEHGEQFFVSTNLSNARMIHLLRKLGFIDSGVVYNLDPGDPEVIFTNRSANKPDRISD